jgi:hypothetical protein
MRAAIKLQITIPKDRLVQLPEDLPEGPAEILVLYPEAAAESERAVRRARAADRGRAAQAEGVNYFARLTSRQPLPLSAGASLALDEADRGER